MKEIPLFEKRYFISKQGRVLFQYKKGEFRERKLVADKDGYMTVNLKDSKGKVFCKKIHRLVAEAFIENVDNSTQVNHINGVKTCNTVENLEWCTISENNTHALETGLRAIGVKNSNNTTGFYGVCLDSSGSKYTASVKRSNKRIPLGSYSTPEAAHKAVTKALLDEAKGLKITAYKPPVKIITQSTPEGTVVATYSSIAEAEKATGIPNQSIGKVIAGKNKTTGGFLWSRTIT